MTRSGHARLTPDEAEVLRVKILELWPSHTMRQIAGLLGHPIARINKQISLLQAAGRAEKLGRAENNRRIQVAYHARRTCPAT